MRIAIVVACFAFLAGIPGLTGIDLTKTGPSLPPLEMPQHGGGGGP